MIGSMKIFRSLLFFVAGSASFGAVGVFVLVAKEFLAGGAGTQLGVMFLNWSGALIGTVALIGFILGAFFCFAIGAVLCALGIVGLEGTDSHEAARALLQRGK